MTQQIKSLSFIGSGRVANHLGSALQEQGISIDFIFSRDKDHAKRLAEKLDADFTSEIADVTNSDLVIIAVSDDAIEEVAKQLPAGKDCLVAHTGGAVPLNVLPKHLRRAVFYPLQSFTIDKTIAWQNVPFCIEADNDDDLNSLGELAELVSSKIHILTSEQRKNLHLAAVFANNFVNLMFEFSEQILKDAEIEREILQPLILETANKMLLQNASKSQTGPASRGDRQTISAHEQLLSNRPELLEIYQFLTRKIYSRTHGKEL